MPFIKDSKCKQNCKHSYYIPKKGWFCEECGECFMCSLCDRHENKLTQEEYNLLKEIGL